MVLDVIREYRTNTKFHLWLILQFFKALSHTILFYPHNHIEIGQVPSAFYREKQAQGRRLKWLSKDKKHADLNQTHFFSKSKYGTSHNFQFSKKTCHKIVSSNSQVRKRHSEPHSPGEKKKGGIKNYSFTEMTQVIVPNRRPRLDSVQAGPSIKQCTFKEAVAICF